MATPAVLLSVADLSAADIRGLVENAVRLKQGAAEGHLDKKVLALLFEKPSLRTRVSFDVAMWQLGGHAIYLSPEEVGLGKRESVPDAARTLSRYVDCIAARTFSHDTVETLARHAQVPVINALSDYEHPCQTLADLLTIFEKKGSLSGLNVAYVGDGNNVTRSLLLGAALMGMRFTMASPPDYALRGPAIEQAERFASESGAVISFTPDPSLAVKDADVVYTDVWTSMGQENEAEARRLAFSAFQVDARLLALAKRDAVFMHPLPAHQGEEVAQGLLEHPQSVVFDQAENRLHIQKAILVNMLRTRTAQ